MKYFSRSIQLICLSIVFGGANALCVAKASAIPLGDAYDIGQAEFQASPQFHLRNQIPPVLHPSMHPNLNDEVNESHPIPDYIKNLPIGQAFPVYYEQLLEIDPKDQVQSKIFDKQAFSSTRRIGISRFENKTSGPFKDDNAGNIVAKQIARELQSVNKYFIFPPPPISGDVKLTIVKQLPISKHEKLKSPNTMAQPSIPGLPYTNKKMDAVMIGAVTKYMDSHRTRSGNIEKSLSSTIEFGAFLISTYTGEVIWGARFIGSQPTGLSSFLLNSGPSWLSKERLSQLAMKNVLKAFH